ncbi:MAG: hypothetical protein OEM05_12545 [Myxococcales bacterium]|nr:hypothetical protein [Myxococcales bacterium]
MKLFRSLALLLLLALAAPSHAQGLDDFDAVPLTDVLEVIVLEGEILAIDANGGGQLSEDLHLAEEVLWTGARGRIGVVITNERLLAVSIGASSWREIRFERGEQYPSHALLGDRVGIAVTPRRAIGFESGSGQLFEYRLGPREGVLATRVGENVVVVVTSRKAVALSPSGGFVETRLQLKEKLRDVRVRSNVATVRTDRRLLIFRGPTHSWAEQHLELRQSG